MMALSLMKRARNHFAPSITSKQIEPKNCVHSTSLSESADTMIKVLYLLINKVKVKNVEMAVVSGSTPAVETVPSYMFHGFLSSPMATSNRAKA